LDPRAAAGLAVDALLTAGVVAVAVGPQRAVLRVVAVVAGADARPAAVARDAERRVRRPVLDGEVQLGARAVLAVARPPAVGQLVVASLAHGEHGLGLLVRRRGLARLLG